MFKSERLFSLLLTVMIVFAMFTLTPLSTAGAEDDPFQVTANPAGGIYALNQKALPLQAKFYYAGRTPVYPEPDSYIRVKWYWSIENSTANRGNDVGEAEVLWDWYDRPYEHISTYTPTTRYHAVRYYFAVLEYTVLVPTGSGIGIRQEKREAVTETARIEVIAPDNPRPTELTAQASGEGVTLNWKDNSPNEDGFIVERSVAGKEQWYEQYAGETCNPDLGTVGEQITTYFDFKAEIGKTYTYRVRAFIGTTLATRAYTEYSNEVTVIMPSLTFTQAPTEPEFTGPTSLTLMEGYAATSTDVYTVTGYPEPTVVKTGGDPRIVWNNADMRVDIAAGLTQGTYSIRLEASNGVGSEATLFLYVSITDPDSPGMFNFVKVNTYAYGMFADVNENEWYGYAQQGAVANAYEYGVMQGDALMIFDPLGNITVGQAIAMAARVRSIYRTGKSDFTQGVPWYQVYVDYAIETGMIVDNDFSDYTRAATRAEMAFIFSRAIPRAEFPEVNVVISLPDVNNGTPYSDSILMLYKAGVLTGNDSKGTFNPGSNITRAEASAIISRIILPETRVGGRSY